MNLTIIPATVKINAPWINEFLRIFHLIKKYGKAALKSGKTYYVKVVAEKKVKINKKYKTFKSTLYYEGKSIKVK